MVIYEFQSDDVTREPTRVSLRDVARKCTNALISSTASIYQDRIAANILNRAFNSRRDDVSKKTLCVDFDGVIHSYVSGWQGADVIPDPPVEGALEWLSALVGEGYDVCIYSSRSGQDGGVSAMRDWLLRHDSYERTSTFSLGIKEMLEDGLIRFPTEKPAAYLTIDDRCIAFRGTFPSVQEIENFRPWNEELKNKSTNKEAENTVVRLTSVAENLFDCEDGVPRVFMEFSQRDPKIPPIRVTYASYATEGTTLEEAENEMVRVLYDLRSRSPQQLMILYWRFSRDEGRFICDKTDDGKLRIHTRLAVMDPRTWERVDAEPAEPVYEVSEPRSMDDCAIEVGLRGNNVHVMVACNDGMTVERTISRERYLGSVAQFIVNKDINGLIEELR